MPFFLQEMDFGYGRMKKISLDLDYLSFPFKVAQVLGIHRSSPF
jgi:hypothetical protein